MQKMMLLYKLCKVLPITICLLLCNMYVYAWEEVGNRAYSTPLSSSSVSTTYVSDSGNIFMIYTALNK